MNRVKESLEALKVCTAAPASPPLSRRPGERFSAEHKSTRTFSYNPSSPRGALSRACSARISANWRDRVFRVKVWIELRFGFTRQSRRRHAVVLRSPGCWSVFNPTPPPAPSLYHLLLSHSPRSLVSWAICRTRWAGLTLSSSCRRRGEKVRQSFIYCFDFSQAHGAVLFCFQVAGVITLKSVQICTSRS